MLNYSIVTAIILQVIAEYLKHPLRFIKPIPIFLMIVYIQTKTSQRNDNVSNFVGKGLGLCIIGDILLMFKGNQSFTIGTIFFLVGHILYCIAFQSGEKIRKRSALIHIFTCVSIVTAITLLVSNIYLTFQGMPNKVLFPIYGCVITTMVIFATLRYDRTSAYSFYLIFCGALLFGMSDNLLGYLKFNQIHTNLGRMIVMLTYYFGQFLIMHGAVYHSNLQKSMELPLRKKQ